MKICVYAIALNESQFCDRFVDAASEADLIVVADTGSADDTVKLLEQRGVTVHQISVKPWRFDDARNAALALLPGDIDVCVSLDLDEVLQPGWREEIERVWTPGQTTRLSYLFAWQPGHDPFWYDKIHSRHGYRWTRPCHERLWPDRIEERWAWADPSFLMVQHLPDPTKSRGQYLDLLRVSVEEMPDDPFNAFYYARERGFVGDWAGAIQEGERYLALPKATNPNERAYATRVIARSYEELGDYDKALFWNRRGCAEAPNTREPWFDLAKLCYRLGRWPECYGAATTALEIVHREAVYTCDATVWGGWTHGYASIAAFRLGLPDEALRHAKLAVSLEPDDLILRQNVVEIEKAMSPKRRRAA